MVKNSLLESQPDLAQKLFAAFKASKESYLARLDAGEADTPFDKTALANAEIVGDPFPFGVEANRKALETVIDYAIDQKVIAKRERPEELFAAGTADLT